MAKDVMTAPSPHFPYDADAIARRGPDQAANSFVSPRRRALPTDGCLAPARRFARPAPITAVPWARRQRTTNNDRTIAAFADGKRGENLTRFADKQILAMQNRATPRRTTML
jgi:hypothetical protein